MKESASKKEPTTCGCCRPPRRHLPIPNNFIIERVSKSVLALVAASSPLVFSGLVQSDSKKRVSDYSSSIWFALSWIGCGSLLSLLAKSIAEHKLLYVVLPFLKINCDKDFDPIKEKLERVACSLRGCLIDIVIFSLAAITSYDSDYYPQGFGGRLDLERMISKTPEQSDLFSKIVLLLVLGHYLERTYFEFAHARPSPIFFTKVLHHVITMLLITACLATGDASVGIPVILTHTLTGIFLCASKLLNETIFGEAYAFNYVMLLLTWFYCRIWVFFTEVVAPLAQTWSRDASLSLQKWSLFFLLIVFLLLITAFNVYWGVQLVLIGQRKGIISFRFYGNNATNC